MTSFKFGFNCAENDDNEDDQDLKNDIKWLEAEEIFPCIKGEEVEYIFKEWNEYTYGDIKIKHVFPEDAIKYLINNENESDISNNTLSAESQHSDLLVGKYEGGLKIWECTNDLAEYLLSENIQWKDSLVMDLGCGAGILGLIAFVSGAKVHFQDYNKEVIDSVTIPNCYLNTSVEEPESLQTRCKFFVGDWGYLTDLLKDSENHPKYSYKYILSSETIYNADNHQKLLNFIKCHLKEDGVAYLAAKTHYFGVGGSVGQFRDAVDKDGRMNSEICWKSDGGLRREIIKLTFK